MINENNKCVNFSEYDFVKLYCALNIKAGNSPLIVCEDLENKLYKFYSVPEFKNLFGSLGVQRDFENLENSRVWLGTAIQNTYLDGLSVQQDIVDDCAIITLSSDKADEIISLYDENIVLDMASLVEMMYAENMGTTGPVYKKVRN